MNGRAYVIVPSLILFATLWGCWVDPEPEYSSMNLGAASQCEPPQAGARQRFGIHWEWGTTIYPASLETTCRGSGSSHANSDFEFLGPQGIESVQGLTRATSFAMSADNGCSTTVTLTYEEEDKDGATPYAFGDATMELCGARIIWDHADAAGDLEVTLRQLWAQSATQGWVALLTEPRPIQILGHSEFRRCDFTGPEVFVEDAILQFRAEIDMPMDQWARSQSFDSKRLEWVLVPRREAN